MKLFSKTRYFNEYEITINNSPILQYGEKFLSKDKEKHITLFSKSLTYQFLDKIIEEVGDEFDYYFLIRTAGIGEAYLLNFMYDEIKEKTGFKNACFVTHRSVYKDMFKMYHPDVSCFVTNFKIHPYNVYLKDRFIKYKNKTFQVVHSTLEESIEIFTGYENNIGEPYPIVIRKLANATKFANLHPTISNSDKQIIKQIKNSGLNLDKFVFFIAESNGTVPYSDSFWFSISDELKKRGYSIFVNTKDGKSKYGYSLPISLSQAYYLASLSKGIVAMRSGMLEFLSTTADIPLHCIYTRHAVHPVCAEYMINSSTLLNYPNVKKENVFEYDTEKLKMEDIIANILKNIL